MLILVALWLRDCLVALMAYVLSVSLTHGWIASCVPVGLETLVLSNCWLLTSYSLIQRIWCVVQAYGVTLAAIFDTS